MQDINTEIINQLYQAYAELNKRLKRDQKIDFHTFAVLKILATTQEDTIPVGSLSRILKWKKPETTKVLNELEDRNCITRTVCTSDRRVTLVKATSEGRDFYEELCEYLVENNYLATEQLAGYYLLLTKTVSDECGTSITKMRVLRYLYDNRDDITRVSDVALGLGIAPNTISAATRKVIDEGYVGTGSIKEDMRAVSLTLTPEGLKKIERDSADLRMTPVGKSLQEVFYESVS